MFVRASASSGGGTYQTKVSSFVATGSTQAINVGFEPKYLTINWEGGLSTSVYDQNLSSTQYKYSGSATSCRWYNIGQAPLMSINANGFSISGSADRSFTYVAVG